MKKIKLTLVFLIFGIMPLLKAQDQTVNGKLKVESNADVGAGQDPAFLIGDRTGAHIAIDDNEIGAFNNNANSTLHINGSNSTSNTSINPDGPGKVGIGTGSPRAKLHIKSNADVGAGQDPALLIGDRTGAHIAIDDNEIGAFNNNANSTLYINGSQSTSNTLINPDGPGNVGIGNVNPESKFHVRGVDLGELANDQSILTTIDGKVGNKSKFQILNKRNQDGSDWHNTSLRLQRTVDVTPMAFIDFGIEDKTSNYGLAFGTRNGFSGTQKVRMVIEEDGDVGIGTTDTEGYKLAIAGNVIAEEVKVELQANWPDYVFDDDYELPSLEETENYIKQKGHLKDIPDAQEVAENGIDLGAMNAKLLQKIEELTLYTIDQQKAIESQAEEIEELKKLFKQN